MTKKHDKKRRTEGVKQANTIIVVTSLLGLTACFLFALSRQAEIPIFLYAIFGGGVLGTDNILKLIKSVFRVGSND